MGRTNDVDPLSIRHFKGSGTALRPDAKAGSGLRDSLIVPGNPVALAELGPGPHMLFLVHLPRGELRGDLLVLLEIALEPARRQNLHNPDGLGARVAQNVGHIAWLEDIVAGLGNHYLAADVTRRFAFQHEVALVLAGVGMRGDHHTQRKAPLFDRERSAVILWTMSKTGRWAPSPGAMKIFLFSLAATGCFLQLRLPSEGVVRRERSPTDHPNA
jgi:hypothetical protein